MTIPDTVIRFYDCFVILYRHEDGGREKDVPTCNVCAYETNSTFKWIIQPATPYGLASSDHFIKIRADEKTEELYAITRSGRKFLVNRENGQLIREVT